MGFAAKTKKTEIDKLIDARLRHKNSAKTKKRNMIITIIVVLIACVSIYSGGLLDTLFGEKCVPLTEFDIQKAKNMVEAGTMTDDELDVIVEAHYENRCNLDKELYEKLRS